MARSCVLAGVGGYYASKQGGLAGVFRCAADGSDWKHTLSEVETFTVFVHPHDPNLVFAGTPDGVYRSTDRGQNFSRADFPDQGVQVWSFLPDDADPKRMLAGGSPVAVYLSEDGGAGADGVAVEHAFGLGIADQLAAQTRLRFCEAQEVGAAISPAFAAIN